MAATAGHGPGALYGPGHAPKFPGILQGRDVLWIATDYPQSLTIWQEEVRPRFAGIEAAEISEQRRQVRLAGCGMLEVRSAEAIDGIRGKGKNVGGFILDEPAHWDLEYAWRNVILPILLDNGGWCIMNSSPNSGLDGNAEKITPSFFNRLCDQVEAGERGREWSFSHRTARDNPVISADALAALIAEYPPDSPQLAQEVEAKRIIGGAGLAFPEWDPAFHTFRHEVPQGWRWFAGMDWGYTSPGCFVLLASGPDREVLCRKEHYFKGRTPEDVGRTIGQMLLRSAILPEFIAGDSAMWATTDGGETVAEGVQRGILEVMTQGQHATLIAAPKGAGSRVGGKMLVHDALRFDRANVREDGTLAQYHQPRLRVHEDCANVVRTLPRLPLDPKNPEDVDTDAEDHAYDALRYALAYRAPAMEKADARPWSRDASPGYHTDGTKRQPWNPGYDERYERELMRRKASEQGQGFYSGMSASYEDQ